MHERRVRRSEHHLRCFQRHSALTCIQERCMTSFYAQKSITCKCCFCETNKNHTIYHVKSSNDPFSSF
jgi:hypothetical protein